MPILLWVWVGTFVISFGLDIAMTFKLVKNMADKGYKINPERFSNLSNIINPDLNKITIMFWFVPFINVCLSSYRHGYSEKNIETLMYQFKIT